MSGRESSPLTLRLALNRFPSDVLGCIASRLQFTDRLAFLSCCRATRGYYLSTPSGLFPDLTFKLERPETAGRLAAWLADNKQQLGKLRLHLPTADAELEAMTLLVLGALSGSSMQVLKITSSKGQVRAGSWLRMLQHMHSLHVTAKELRLGSGLADVMPLTRLTLVSRGSPFVFPPGGLPPRLVKLSLSSFDPASFGAALQAAGPLPFLRALSLTSPDGVWLDEQWGLVAAHSQLTSLTLEKWELDEIPPQFTVLTALRELGLRNSIESVDASLGVLTSFTKLTKLCLVSNSLGEVLPSIAALPALKDLDLTENFLCVIPTLAASSSLTRLALDVDVLDQSAEGFTALRALRTLVVHEPDWVEEELSYSEVGKVLKSLSQLPSFEVLDATSVYGDPNPFHAAKELLLQLGALPFSIRS